MKRWKWPVVWLVQMVLMLLAGAAFAPTEMLGAMGSGLVQWVVLPLLGAVSAYRATRRGLLNYVAWLAPPVCMAAGYCLVWSYLPEPGPVLLCAFVSLVGAAAGEVMNREIERKNAGKRP